MQKHWGVWHNSWNLHPSAMPKRKDRKAEVMPNRRAKASTRALPKACFRGCGPGQLLLTEEEFKMVQKELARIGEERHFKFELVPMSDVKEPPKKTKQKAAKPQSKPSASSATKRRTEEVSGTAPKRRRRRREHTQEDWHREKGGRAKICARCWGNPCVAIWVMSHFHPKHAFGIMLHHAQAQE